MNQEARLDAVFAALADPTRRRILARLAQGEAAVGDLAQPFDVSLPAISKQLSVLARAGLVRRERTGRFRRCRLDAGALAAASRWLDEYRLFWDETLESLARYVEGGREK
jgi:DNA-binding transcriptional ArsR family regulator